MISKEMAGLGCLCSPVSEPLSGRHEWLGVIQMSGDGSNHWGLESSGSFHTPVFGTCAGMTQKLVSARTVDGDTRKPLPGAWASSQRGGLRVITVPSRRLRTRQAGGPVEPGGDCGVFCGLALEGIYPGSGATYSAFPGQKHRRACSCILKLPHSLWSLFLPFR
ncbi:hypothetical protein HJG60_008767 [Phyllostomus discolor]|uniref:Uncharacterized protein n=1 Tax=Phyllostomus discolor TaxID=89673 RepID=A0A833YW85_9CHIR|nr:hypothetical protein HJG60_008767 [Phyllostomus discolor]